jgi:hypothetical protein
LFIRIVRLSAFSLQLVVRERILLIIFLILLFSYSSFYDLFSFLKDVCQ